MSAPSANICCIAGCDNLIAPRSVLKACALCRQSLRSWEKRPVSHILRRSTNLRKYTARMLMIAVVDEQSVKRTPHTDLTTAQILAEGKRKVRKGRKS